MASNWDNLLLVCQLCGFSRYAKRDESSSASINGKGNRFPLENESARAYLPGEEIAEEPLLIDPTRDDPELHLIYGDDGVVFGRTERGNVAISVLGLNREPLKQRRYDALRSFNNLVELYNHSSMSEDLKEELLRKIKNSLLASAPYAGMKRQLYSNVVLHTPDKSDAAQKDIAEIEQTLKTAKQFSQEYREKLSNYSLESEEGLRTYKTVSRNIKSISLRNIRAIKELDIDFENMSGGVSRWLMLLGENGTGKSTVLQAIALTLSGSQYIRDLIKNERFDHTHLVRYGAKSGIIAVQLSGFTKPFKMFVTKDGLELHSPDGKTTTINKSGTIRGGWQAPTIILAYGATRLLPRKLGKVSGTKYARIDNLFDPFVALENAKEWLLKRDSRQFNDAAIILKDLLSLDDDAYVLKEKEEIYVKIKGSKILLKDLSDGYQTVVAMTVDILSLLSNIWDNLLNAEGIVLIDELDAHLHPTWQMQIVSSLRQAFKGVQFITSTHQPLCLRGLKKGEVAVMQRDEEGLVSVETDLPSPGDFRVDQLLTSEFFGMNSTIDPDTEFLFDKY